MYVISHPDFVLLRQQNRRSISCNNEIAQVQFNCADCNKSISISFKTLAKRKQFLYEAICTICCGKKHKSVSGKDAEFRKDPNYVKKLSEGVKKAIRERDPLIEAKRLEMLTVRNKSDRRRKQNSITSSTNWQNPEYRQKVIEKKKTKYDLVFNGIRCDSITEYAFLKFANRNGWQIEKCNFLVPYFWQNKDRHYLPDFLVTVNGETIVYEIKGIYDREWKKYDESFKRGFLDKDFILCKFEALKGYCLEKGWKCRMLTLSDKDFAQLYRKTLRELKHENSQQENILI